MSIRALIDDVVATLGGDPSLKGMAVAYAYPPAPAVRPPVSPTLCVSLKALALDSGFGAGAPGRRAKVELLLELYTPAKFGAAEGVRLLPAVVQAALRLDGATALTAGQSRCAAELDAFALPIRLSLTAVLGEDEDLGPAFGDVEEIKVAAEGR